MNTTEPTPALRTLTLTAALLNAQLPPGSAWQATGEPLAKASREQGRLERVILWKLLQQDLPGVDSGLDDFPQEALDALLEHLNAVHAEPGTGWYSEGLHVEERAEAWRPRDLGGAEVLGFVAVWRLTDEAAREAGLLI
ncbi:hypothetical protein [Nonomuraea sp. NPDC003214]